MNSTEQLAVLIQQISKSLLDVINVIEKLRKEQERTSSIVRQLQNAHNNANPQSPIYSKESA